VDHGNEVRKLGPAWALFWALVLGSLLGALVLGTFVLGASAQDGPGVLRVEVEDIRHERGKIGCTLWDGPRGFPGEVEHATRSFWVANRGEGTACVFFGVPPGEYAVSVLHDEDGNGRMNRGFFGAPEEGWGVSNDAEPGTMSGPSYEDARFAFEGGTRRMRIHLRY
jgi:uncharacterized protein (DUF2141 family)